MSATEQKPKTPSARTTFFATLGSLLHAQRNSAPSHRRGFVATLAALVILAALTAAPASAKEVYLQGFNGEPPTYGTGGLPTGIALDQANGVMYVVTGFGTVEKYNEAGQPADFSKLGESTFSPGGSFETVAVDNSTEASDPNRGDLYIANSGNGVVEKYNEAGELTDSFAAPPSPRGMAVDSQGDLYVASNNEEGKVFGFSPAGTPLNSGNPVLVIPAPSPSITPNPYGLALNSNGDLYVTQTNYNSSRAETEGVTSEFAPEAGGVFNPTPIGKELPGGVVDLGVAVNQQTNDVFVADYVFEFPYGAIKEYNEHGEEIETLPHDEFWIPYGVAVNEAHPAVYVTSAYAASVEVFHGYKKGTMKLEVSGFGAVTADPEGITPPGAEPIKRCEKGKPCEGEFEEGSTVTLTARPIRADKVAYWEGCTHESGDSCEVAIGSGFAPVKAVFQLEQYGLTVNETGTGAGAVDCGAGECAPAYSADSYLTLNPLPAPHSVFAGWSGACASFSGSCVIERLTENVEVTATFDQLKPAISFTGASRVGQSTATVSAQVNPEGAPTTCKFEYGTTTLYGSEVPCATGPGSGADNVQVTGALGGLAPNTAYFFRLGATNSGGTTLGEGEAFTTAAPETCATNATLCSKVSHQIMIGNVKREGSVLALSVTVPGAGALTATGPDIEAANASSTGAETLILRLKLTKTAKLALKRAKGHKLKIELKVNFTPTGSTSSSVRTAVTFRRAKAR